jgi:hypothetical protein
MRRNPTGKRTFPFLDAEGHETVPGLAGLIETLRLSEADTVT